MLISVLLYSSGLACPPLPPWDLHHPKSWQEAYPDTVFWLTEHSGGPRSWSLLDDQGLEIPLTEHRIGALLGLFPDEPLAVGGYQLLGEGSSPIPAVAELEVIPGAEQGSGPPQPTHRHRYHDYVTPDLGYDCYSPAPRTGVSYGVCGEHAVTVFALGPDEPPSPLEAPDEVVALWSGPFWLEGAHEARVWIGGLDGAGRFTGWTPDDVALPAPGLHLEEIGEDFETGVCGSPGAWQVEGRFLSADLSEAIVGKLQIDPRPTGAYWPDDPDAEEPSIAGCGGCHTGAGGPDWGGLLPGLWLLLGLRRRGA
ncbi:MAG TPA: hypothetical protein ENK18_03000 [Deltaproteobacteria bacterium]|nr:hypothetical protein [Deltaproteobacteria bacterium]